MVDENSSGNESADAFAQSSDSSMVDENRAASNPGGVGHEVQIPLWSMKTSAVPLKSKSQTRSDSSMVDENRKLQQEGVQSFTRSDSSMVDENNDAVCNVPLVLLFRFLYGR